MNDAPAHLASRMAQWRWLSCSLLVPAYCSSRLAAVPQDRLGHAARAAVVQQVGVAAHGGSRPSPQSGGVLHSSPVAAVLGAAVGELGAHVVQQQIRVGMDRLAAKAPGRADRRRSRAARRDTPRIPTRGRARGRGAPRRRSRFLPRRHGQRLVVERHEAERLGVDLGSAAGRPPRGLVSATGVAFSAGRSGEVMPMSPSERRRHLRLDGRLPRLPAEATEREPSPSARADAVRPAADAVAVAIVFVREREQASRRERSRAARLRTRRARRAARSGGPAPTCRSRGRPPR